MSPLNYSSCINNFHLYKITNVVVLGVFWQSNTSVYALYNDAPPDLKYIQKYGHTKGTVQSAGRNLLLSSYFHLKTFIHYCDHATRLIRFYSQSFHCQQKI